MTDLRFALKMRRSASFSKKLKLTHDDAQANRTDEDFLYALEIGTSPLQATSATA